MKQLLQRMVGACARTLRALAWGTGALARAIWRGSGTLVRSRAVLATFAALVFVVRVGLFAGALAILCLGIGWLCFQRVSPSIAGVRARNFGGGGIEARDYDAGLHWSIRALDDWHFVDMSTQVLAFGWQSEGGEHPALEVRMRDGNMAHVGLSVPYRVKIGEAHRLVAEGLRTAYRERVRSTVEKLALAELSSFAADELASTEKRLAWCESILPRINDELASYHALAERVLITQVFFGIEYEKKLQAKQLTRQTALLETARTEVERQRLLNQRAEQEIDAAEKRIRAEADKEIAIAFAEGRRRILDLESEAKLYDRRRRAEAQSETDRLLAEGELALAKVESLKQELDVSLYEGEIGRLLLAKRAAENLNMKSVTLNSNDPRVPSVLDLDAFVEILLGRAPK